MEFKIMKMKRIVVAMVVLFTACVSCLAQTDAQIRAKFQKLIDAMPTAMQKKQMEQNRDMILNIKDPNARKQIYEMLTGSVVQTEKVIEEQNNPPEKNSGIVKTEQLKNYKTDGKTIEQLSVTYRFKGRGTKENPFLISEPMELIIAGVVSNSMDDRYLYIYDEKGNSIGPVNACYKLVKDLDFSKYPWDKPIGNVAYRDEYPFTGVLDGDGHTISNLTGYAPLIECIDVNGVVKNLIIKNANIKLDKRFSNASPFCESNNGAIVACSFEGSLEGVNNFYNIASSNNKNGMAVCCFANNKKGKSTDFKDIKIFGCDKNLSDKQLNDILSTWNALYVYNGDTYLNSLMNVKSGKLVYGKPKKKDIPANSARDKSMTFHYAYSLVVSRNLFQLEDKVYLDNLLLPIDDLSLFTSDFYVALEPNGGSVVVENKKLDTYRLTIYSKQENGTFKPTVLDEGKAHIIEVYDYNSVKALHVRYNAGGKDMFLLTEDAYKCLKEKTILPETENGMEMPASCFYNGPKKKIVDKCIKAGKW